MCLSHRTDSAGIGAATAQGATRHSAVPSAPPSGSTRAAQRRRGAVRLLRLQDPLVGVVHDRDEQVEHDHEQEEAHAEPDGAEEPGRRTAAARAVQVPRRTAWMSPRRRRGALSPRCLISDK